MEVRAYKSMAVLFVFVFLCSLPFFSSAYHFGPSLKFNSLCRARKRSLCCRQRSSEGGDNDQNEQITPLPERGRGREEERQEDDDGGDDEEEEYMALDGVDTEIALSLSVRAVEIFESSARVLKDQGEKVRGF